MSGFDVGNRELFGPCSIKHLTTPMLYAPNYVYNDHIYYNCYRDIIMYRDKLSINYCDKYRPSLIAYMIHLSLPSKHLETLQVPIYN